MNSVSRNTVVLSLLLGAAMLATACGRTNELPNYMPKIQSAWVVTFTSNAPTVAIGSTGGDDMFDAVNDMAAFGGSIEARKKLERAVDPKAVSQAMTDTFKSRLNETLGTQLAANANSQYDSRVQVTVNQYGLEAANMTAPLYFFYDVEVQMVYMPENKLIWEYDTTIHEALSNEHVSIGIIGTSMNLKQLSDLQDEEVAAIFDEMGHVAGDVLVSQLLRDSTHN